MHQIRAKNRYEIDGKTVLDVYKDHIRKADGELPEIGEQVMFSSGNDSPGIHETDRYLKRSIMIVDEIKEYPGGYYVTVSLDIGSMPVTRRAIDGYIQKLY